MNTEVMQLQEKPAFEQADRANSLSVILDAKTMESAMTIAKVMASSKVTVPKHLQGQEGDCLAVVLQSITWGMSPFVVAQKTHLINGTLGYEAQLVNAVVQSLGYIKGTFNYEYQGAGENFESYRIDALVLIESILFDKEDDKEARMRDVMHKAVTKYCSDEVNCDPNRYCEVSDDYLDEAA